MVNTIELKQEVKAFIKQLDEAQIELLKKAFSDESIFNEDDLESDIVEALDGLNITYDGFLAVNLFDDYADGQLFFLSYLEPTHREFNPEDYDFEYSEDDEEEEDEYLYELDNYEYLHEAKVKVSILIDELNKI